MENGELLDDIVEDHHMIDYIPRVGHEFVSEEDAYNFYNEYGRRIGFSIRKERGNRNKNTGLLTSRLFVCSKEGFRRPDKRDYKTKNARVETRTGCNASMLIKFIKATGKFEIQKVVTEHNHMLYVASCAHMMCSQQKMYEAQTMDESRMKVQGSYALVKRQASGHDGLGYTKEDPRNYLQSKRQRALKYGEAESFDGYEIEVDPELQVASRYRLLCSNMIKIASRASECEEAYIFLRMVMKSAGEIVDQIIRQNVGMEQVKEMATTSLQQSALALEEIEKENHPQGQRA